MDEDRQQLDLVGIFHYVIATLTALFACFPIIHLVVGIAILGGGFDEADSGDAPPRWFGLFFVLLASILILVGWGLALCMFVAGRSLRSRTRYLFCLVVAGVECVFMPLGTVLGVFTIIVLQRTSVKRLFGYAAPEANSADDGR